MIKAPIILERITYESYIDLAKITGFETKNFDRVREGYPFAKIVSAPFYSSFFELLDDLQKGISREWIRLLHVPGTDYSSCEKEFRKRKDDPLIYTEFAEKAEKANALNVELNLISELSKIKSYRGNKMMFRRQERIYLAKLYIHKPDFYALGIKSNIDEEFHAVQAIYSIDNKINLK